jgi:hypothetical protein
MKNREEKVFRKLEGFSERQAERERKRRHHVVRRTKRGPLGDDLPNVANPVRRDEDELVWMNRGSRI